MKKYETMADEQLIRKLREGETAIADFIVNKYKSMVKKKAKAMFLLGGENDDLIQEGMIGLFKAIRKYDLSQEVSFASFADLCVSRQMSSAIKMSNRKKHSPLNSYVSLYQSDDDEAEYEPTSTVLYEVTDTGRHVARVLSDSLMVSVREKSYRSALRHLSFERQGAYVDHSYRPDGEGFLVNCSIKDHNGVVMDLTVRADSEYQLRRMLNNYSERPEVVFRGVVALLSGDVNYLFED